MGPNVLCPFPPGTQTRVTRSVNRRDVSTTIRSSDQSTVADRMDNSLSSGHNGTHKAYVACNYENLIGKPNAPDNTSLRVFIGATISDRRRRPFSDCVTIGVKKYNAYSNRFSRSIFFSFRLSNAFCPPTTTAAAAATPCTRTYGPCSGAYCSRPQRIIIFFLSFSLTIYKNIILSAVACEMRAR